MKTKSRNSVSKSSLESPPVLTSATTPDSTGKKRMTKKEKEEAKARARLAMTGHMKSPAKSSKGSATKKVKVEDTHQANNGNNLVENKSNVEPEPMDCVPPQSKRFIARGFDGPTMTQPKATEFVNQGTARLGRVSFDEDTVAIVYQPVPKLLMGMQLSNDPSEITHLLLELLNEIKSVTSPTSPSSQFSSMEGFQIRSELCSEAASCVLLGVAQKWKSHEEIQVRYLQCLQYLAKDASSSILTFGGVETIVNTMHRFLNSSIVLTFGCACLCSLFGEVTDAKNRRLVAFVHLHPAWYRFVHEMDGVALLLRVMELCQQSASVQVKCITLFANLATYPETRRALDTACPIVAAVSVRHHAEKNVMNARKRFMMIMFEA